MSFKYTVVFDIFAFLGCDVLEIRVTRYKPSRTPGLTPPTCTAIRRNGCERSAPHPRNSWTGRAGVIGRPGL